VDEISRVRTREKDAAVRRGVTLRRRRVVVGCCGPEGSDFAAEESCGEGDPDAEEGYEEYEEDDPDAEEGYEGVWDEVQEALSACRKLCQRWSMKSLTRLPRPSKVSSVATLFGIIPSVSAVLGCVQYICTFLYHVYNSVLVRRIFNGSLEGLR